MRIVFLLVGMMVILELFILYKMMIVFFFSGGCVVFLRGLMNDIKRCIFIIKECSVGLEFCRRREGDGCFGSDVSPLHRLVGQDSYGYSVKPV